MTIYDLKLSDLLANGELGQSVFLSNKYTQSWQICQNKVSNEKLE